jgi:PAS domain S-box-containing protein
MRMRSRPLEITFIYVVFGTLWILFSDQVLAYFVSDPAAFIVWSSYKGIAYVVVTALMLFLILSQVFGVIAKTYDSLRSKELRALSEKKFADTMIESTPGVLYFYDSTGRFLRWNHNFETVTGYSPEEIRTLHPLDLFEGDDKELVAERIATVFETGEATVEAGLVSKDGRRTSYFLTGRLVTYNGEPCLVGVGIDVSARRLAEQKVAESEFKYRELVEQANSIILRWNSDGRITFLNEFGQKFFGYSDNEIIGRNVIGTLVPDSGTSDEDLRRLIEKIRRHPEDFEQNENENIRRNGERVWVAWTNRVETDADGSVRGILSVGTDISARKRAEEERQKSEARYRKLFEFAPVGILIADPDSRYLDANDSICRMLGYPKNELIGLGAKDIIVPAEHHEISPTLDSIKKDAGHYQDWTFVRKDGSTFPAEVSVSKMPDGTLVGMVRDMTERKIAEIEREKRHRAEASDHIKSAFLATMSHELRTPLNSIIGFTGIMLQGLAGDLNEEQAKQLGMVRTSARHLLALVNDVLDISKIEAGQLEVAAAEFDLRASIEKVIELVRPQAEAKGLRLGVQVAPEVRHIVADERRVEQILLNLLSNAIKFTDEGHVGLKAEVVAPELSPGGVELRETAVNIAVSDTGMGIKPDDLQDLFRPFVQIDSGLTRVHDGTGLGLVISRRLADLMQGEISVESEWGKGSTFTLSLPLNSEEKQ